MPIYPKPGCSLLSGQLNMQAVTGHRKASAWVTCRLHHRLVVGDYSDHNKTETTTRSWESFTSRFQRTKPDHQSTIGSIGSMPGEWIRHYMAWLKRHPAFSVRAFKVRSPRCRGCAGSRELPQLSSWASAGTPSDIEILARIEYVSSSHRSHLSGGTSTVLKRISDSDPWNMGSSLCDIWFSPSAARWSSATGNESRRVSGWPSQLLVGTGQQSLVSLQVHLKIPYYITCI